MPCVMESGNRGMGKLLGHLDFCQEMMNEPARAGEKLEWLAKIDEAAESTKSRCSAQAAEVSRCIELLEFFVG